MTKLQSSIIRTSVYPTGECVSTGGYYGEWQQWKAWEFIGDYSECEKQIQQMRDNDYEFMHVVNRHTV